MFQNESVEKVWQDIQPFGDKRKAAAELLLRKLDEAGDISSVAVHWSKSPYAKINLRDHTLGVVRETMKLEGLRMPTDELLVVAALGHDISKIRGQLDRRPGKYFKRLHAIKSASLCQRWLREYLPEQELDEVVRAVNLHHERGHDDEGSILGRLIRADKRTRQNELSQLGLKGIKGCRMIPFSDGATVPTRWDNDLPQIQIQIPDAEAGRLPFFEAVQFLVRLRPHINDIDSYTENGPEAVSMPNGVCYVTTYRVFKIVREWGHEVGLGALMDLKAAWKVSPDRMKNTIRFIGQELRSIGALAEIELPNEQYTHRKFIVITRYGKRRESQGMFYMPIHTRFLGGDIVELEARKRFTPFKYIEEIKPDTGKW